MRAVASRAHDVQPDHARKLCQQDRWVYLAFVCSKLQLEPGKAVG